MTGLPNQKQKWAFLLSLQVLFLLVHRNSVLTKCPTGQGGKMNILVSTSGGPSDCHVALIGMSRAEYNAELSPNEPDGERILFHEPMFGKAEDDYHSGEAVIDALARCADGDNDNPGTALEALVKQAFMLGFAHGVKTECDRIVGRLVG